jgi:glycosyltransferase involved in cell wall biosynthesis
MALLEASACGVPAVATPVAGAAEIVEEGKTGFLAATTGSALALEGRMAALMRLPAEKRAAMGKAARQKILHEFSLERVLDRWEALYGELLAQNTKPRRWGAPIRKRPAAPQQPAS